jgi:hypothetical protein
MRRPRAMPIRPTLVAGSAAVAAVLASSVVVSAQGGGQEEIHACADARGTLRMVDPGTTCASGESRVIWNVEGPQGAAGPAGPAGAQGLPGAKGPRGKPGRAGTLKLSGADVKTAVILARLKAIDEKVGDIKQAVLFNKGYLKVHHQVANGICEALHSHDFRMNLDHSYIQYGGPPTTTYLPLPDC